MLIPRREIAVEIRFAENPGAVKAYADVQLSFPDGELHIIGCAIVAQPGKDPFVAYPAIRGSKRYFPVIAVKGDLHGELVKEILHAYDKAKARR